MRNRSRCSLVSPARRALIVLGLGLAAISSVISACGNGSVQSPFDVDAGSEAGAAGGPVTDGGLNVGEDAGDPTLGGPCADDGQCEDDIPCTADRCDQELQRCRHLPDDSECADEVYCNGEEVCNPKLGCTQGAPVACADSDPCTIDTCIEKTQSCSREPRDADGDGDPVWNCAGGGDCNDGDPTVNSQAKEVCGNEEDDDCDGEQDEGDCVTPANDVCADALRIDASGFTSLSLVATSLDYPTTCAPAGVGLGDIVLALEVPEGEAQDVDIVVQGDNAQVSLAVPAEKCGEIANVDCSPSFGSISRLHLYGLAPGLHPLYVAGKVGADLSLAITFSAATTPPANETCGSARSIESGVGQTVSLVGRTTDLTSACDPDASRDELIQVRSGELVYSFTLAEPRDVRVFASPLDDYGTPQISLRNAACKASINELTCRQGSPVAALFARALPAGQYFVSVASTGPSDVDLRLEESPATSPPADQGCVSPPLLAAGQTLDLSLTDHADAVDVGCLAGAPDSSHTLTLLETSDILLVERLSAGDTGAVSLALPTCAAATRLACGTSSTSPVRAHASGVAPAITE